MNAGNAVVAWIGRQHARLGRNPWLQRLRSQERTAYWRARLKAFGEGSHFYSHVVVHNAELVSVGCRVNIAEFVHIWGGGGVCIGDHTIVASHAVITSQSHDKHAALFRDSQIMARVQIGSNCWIGAGAVILPGVTVGDGSIIGAGAVVTRDVAPGSIVAGVPGRLIEQLPLTSPPKQKS